MESFAAHYGSMYQAIQRYMPGTDMTMIDRAVEYAREKHKDQKRKDGSPYIIHPLAVAEIVAEMGLDLDAVLGAILHDCIEDTDASHDEIAKLFGKTTAELVEGVTKLTRANFSSTEQAQMENLRKMFMAMSKDIRVVLIKIADRLHNMRTMQYQSPAKQISKCRETMDIYAPLAHRLGMQKMKWELEDLSLRYLDPKGYEEIMEYLNAHKEQDEAFMATIQDKIKERLQGVGISNTTYGRIKHVYSIYRKMHAQDKSIEELYDIYAFRVIVDTIPDCYNVLGHVHDLFNLVPGRFKDYISTPKPNMYQSLHTTVIGSQGIPFEVQIRTWQMHETAEYGIAAHWKYKQGTGAGNEKDFEWVRRLLESQQDTDAEDYVHSLKIDMFDDEVFVFTPKGKIVSLPAGSTPIDFAYAIHSGVGNALVGAKVNNRITNIDTPLTNGDIVEIITSKSAKGPSRDWLNICKSNQARTKIKQWFKKEKREENVAHGRAMFEGEIKRLGRKAYSAKADQLAFGAYNKPFAPNRTRFDWISASEANVDAYIADPLCGGDTTLGLFRDMLGGLGIITKQANIERMDKDLPVLFIAGDQDPVGEMGKGVRRAYQAFRKAGVGDVSIKLYHGLRHEILNEASRRYVYQDVLDWLETRAERADKASSSVS